MKRYKFSTTFFKEINNALVAETKIIIKYKCPICEYLYEWKDDYDDKIKEQIKTEVDMHYNEHIIPEPVLEQDPIPEP